MNKKTFIIIGIVLCVILFAFTALNIIKGAIGILHHFIKFDWDEESVTALYEVHFEDFDSIAVALTQNKESDDIRITTRPAMYQKILTEGYSVYGKDGYTISSKVKLSDDF